MSRCIQCNKLIIRFNNFCLYCTSNKLDWRSESQKINWLRKRVIIRLLPIFLLSVFLNFALIGFFILIPIGIYYYKYISFL
jgi:hypothetical protein